MKFSKIFPVLPVILLISVTHAAENKTPPASGTQDSLGAVIRPGENQERFVKWVAEILGKKDPKKLGQLVADARRLFKSVQINALPVVQYLENLYPDLNSSILMEEADTLKLYLGNLDTSKILYTRFVISVTGNKIALVEFTPHHVSQNLSLLALAMHKARENHRTFIEGNGINSRAHVSVNDSLLTVHLMPVTSPDSIAVGGGLRTVFTPLMDSTLESVQLHLGLETHPVDTTRPFQYKTPTIQREWTEIDLAQYLVAQQKLNPATIRVMDYDSTSVKFIQANYDKLLTSIDSLKNFSGFRSDLMNDILKINTAKAVISEQIQAVADIYSSNNNEELPPGTAVWKIRVDTLKSRLENVQSLVEKNLTSIAHAKVLSELDLFLNIWNTKAPEKYSFVLKRKCFCSAAFAGPFVVEMQHKTVKDVKHMKVNPLTKKRNMNIVGAKNKFSVITHFGSYDLNGIIREIKSFIILNKPHIVEIDYNETYGYPDKIRFDPNVFEQGDDLTITVGALHIDENSKEQQPAAEKKAPAPEKSPSRKRGKRF